jgi:hypothetical protein
MLELWEPNSSSSSILPQATVQNSSAPESLLSIVKDAVITKFGLKRPNASFWLDQFECECNRLEIDEKRYWEVLRLFLDGIATEWYESTKIILPESAPWTSWRESFVDAFAQKGWTAAKHAFSFVFLSCSLSEYAIRKLNLLISFNPKMDEETRIALIVTGLPQSVQQRIDPSEISSVSKLLSKINSLERPLSRNLNLRSIGHSGLSFSPKQSSSQTSISPNPFSSLRRTPCPYCTKKGFPDLFHLEANCRRKYFDNQRSNSNTANASSSNISSMRAIVSRSSDTKPAVNNLEMQELLTKIEEIQKNE